MVMKKVKQGGVPESMGLGRGSFRWGSKLVQASPEMLRKQVARQKSLVTSLASSQVVSTRPAGKGAASAIDSETINRAWLSQPM